MLHKRRLNAFTPKDVNLTDTGSIERRIVETIRSIDLDPRHYVLVGSAAITLYGIHLDGSSSDDIRPRDVDLAVTARLFAHLHDTQSLPSGLPIAMKPNYVGTRQHILQARPDHVDSSLLPMDLITRYKPDRASMDNYDSGFIRHYERSSHTLPGSNGIRVATLGHIASELALTSNIASFGDKQPTQDLLAIKQFTSRR